MDEPPDKQHWPVLEKDDAGLKKDLEELLTARAVGDPYGTDGSKSVIYDAWIRYTRRHPERVFGA